MMPVLNAHNKEEFPPAHTAEQSNDDANVWLW